jgi:hypothetical protein
MSVEDFQKPLNILLSTKNKTILSGITPYKTIISEDTAFVRTINITDVRENDIFGKSPGSMLFHPILKNLDRISDVVAILAVSLNWNLFLDGLLTNSSKDMYVELQNTCGQSYTYL